MKKMLLAVACLCMSANVFAVDLVEAVTAIDTLGKSDKALKEIQGYMNTAKAATAPLAKAANAVMAANVVYKSITKPLEIILSGLDSNSLVSKITKGYMGKAAKQMKEINKSLKEMSAVSDLLSALV